MATKSYRDILDEYERAQAFGSFQGSLKDYSTKMNQVFENTDYQEGLRDGWLPRADTYIDRALEYTGLPEASKNLFGAIGGAVGYRQAGENIGQSLPRSLVNMAPLLLGGPVGAIGSGALMGAETYAKTGSAGAGVVTGLSGALMPAFARGGQALAQKAGAGVVGQYVGSQAAALLPNAGAAYKQQQMLNPDQPFDWENFAAETLISQIPFTAYDIPGLNKAIAQQKAMAGLQRPAAAPVQPVAPVFTPEQTAQTKATMDQVTAIAQDAVMTPDEKSAKLAEAFQVLNSPNPAEAKPLPRAQITQTPVTIVGRAEKIKDSYRVVVEDVESAAQLNVNVGDTVFVNETQGTFDPELKKWTFATTVDKVKPARFAMQPEVLPDPSQPELVLRPEGVEPTSLLSETEKVVLTDMGLANPEPRIPSSGEDYVEPLKFAAMSYELAQQEIAANLDKVKIVPETAEQVADVIGNDEKVIAKLETEVAEGKTVMQAFEGERLAQATKAVDVATVKSNVAKKTARELAKAEYERRVTVGNQLIEMYTNAALHPNAEGPLKDIGDVLMPFINKTDTGQLHDAKFFMRIASVVEKWQTGGYGEQSLSRLKGLLKQTVATAKLKTTRTRSYLVNGKRVSGDAATLEKYIIDNNLQEEGLQVITNSKGRLPYLGYRQGDVSLDKKVGESETTIGDISAPTNVAPVAVERFQPSSEQELINHLDNIIADPMDYTADMVADEPTSEQLLDTVEELKVVKEALLLKQELGIGTESFVPELNKRLAAQGIAEVKDMKEVKGYIGRNLSDIMGYVKRNQSFTLGSTVPGDEVLARDMGMYEPTAQKLFETVAKAKDTLGPIADLVEAQLPFVDWNDLRLIRPGDRGWVPGGWSYTDIFGFDPQIVIPKEPTPETLQNWMMGAAHEFVHYNERKMVDRNDAPAQEYKLRKREVQNALRASKDLPKPVRDLISKIVRENHWKRLQDGDPTVAQEWADALGKHKDHFNFVYGMAHPTELTSVLFSDPVAMNIALRTKMPAKGGVVENALQWFSRAINRLFGGTPRTDSAFYQLAQSYDNYLTGGVLKHTYNGLDFIRTQLIAKGTRPEALASRLDTIDRIYARGSLRDSLTGFVRERDNAILPATARVGEINQAVRSSISTVGEPKQTYTAVMNLLADEVPVHKELYNRMKEDLQIVRQTMAEIESGAIQGSVPPNLKKNLALSAVHLNAFKKALDKQANAIEAWGATERLSIEGWEQAQLDALQGQRLYAPPDLPEAKTIQQLVGLERIQGRGMSFIEKNLMLTQHLKEMHPALKNAIQGVYWEQASAVQRATELNLSFIFNPKTKKPDENILRTINRVADNEAMSNATSDLLRWANKEGKSQGLDMGAQFVKDTLSRFKPEDRASILQTIDSIVNRHRVYYTNVLPKALGQLNQAYTSHLIASRESQMTSDQARQVTAQLYEALTLVVDPMRSQEGLAQLQAVGGLMTPETFNAALRHAQGLSLKTKAAVDQIASRPVWVTEQRYGEDMLYMLDEKKKKHTSSGDRKTLDKRRKELEAKGYEFLNYVPAEDKANPHFGMDEDFVRMVEQLESEQHNLLSQAMQDRPDLLEVVNNTNRISGGIRASLAASSPLSKVVRKYAAGREYINMIDNSNQFYVRMNNWLRHKLARAETNVEMTNPEVAGNAEYRRILNQHVDNFLTPDNPTARKIVEGVYFFRLGADLGQAVIEATQQLTTGMSELIAETGSVTDAFALSAKMNKMLAQHKLTKKWSDPEHARLSEILSQYGVGSLATWHDFYDPDTNVVLDANKGTPGHVFGTIKNMARRLSTSVSRYNDVAISHAAFELGRKQGMDFDAAAKFALDIKNRSLYTAGKAGRSVGFWSIKSRPVPQLLGALQNYTLGWFGQMGVNFSKGFGTPPAGLTPVQRQGARKAFAYSLIAQAALAGGLGLPGVGQALALFGQATGIDAKGWLRENLASLFEEDEEYGGMLTNLAMRGVGAAGLPIDPSNRTSISIPFVGVDPFKGFSMENLLGGATGASVKDLVGGLVSAATGDMYGAQQVLPSAIKRPAQLWWGEGDIRDRRGTLLHETTPSEDIRMVFGLQPSRVQAARDTFDALRKAEETQGKRKQARVDQIAALYRKGKTAEAQQELAQLKTDMPEVDIKSLVQSVAQRVQAQTIPYDPRQTSQASSIGMATGLAPTQQVRRSLDSEVYRAFGVQHKVTGRQTREDQLVDQMMQADPFLTRTEARRRLSGRREAPLSYSDGGLPEYLGGSLGAPLN